MLAAVVSKQSAVVEGMEGLLYPSLPWSPTNAGAALSSEWWPEPAIPAHRENLATSEVMDILVTA